MQSEYDPLQYGDPVDGGSTAVLDYDPLQYGDPVQERLGLSDLEPTAEQKLDAYMGQLDEEKQAKEAIPRQVRSLMDLGMSEEQATAAVAKGNDLPALSSGAREGQQHLAEMHRKYSGGVYSPEYIADHPEVAEDLKVSEFVQPFATIANTIGGKVSGVAQTLGLKEDTGRQENNGFDIGISEERMKLGESRVGGYVRHGIAGAAESVLLAPTGAGGMATYFGVTGGNDAYRENRERMGTGKALAYGVLSGATEAAMTMVGARVFGSASGKLADIATQRMKEIGGQTFKEAVVGVAKGIRGEVGEEVGTDLIQIGLDIAFDTDPAQRTPGMIANRIIDTIGTTVVSAGMIESVSNFSNVVSEAKSFLEVAKDYEGEAPPTSRKGFEEATGLKNTNKAQREAFGELIKAKEFDAEDVRIRDQIKAAATSPEEATELITLLESHARSLNMSVGEYAKKWDLQVEKTTQDKAETTGGQDEEMTGPLSLNHEAFHGGPHPKFDRFSTDKIGTGEGGAKYGRGIYFSGRKEVADYYRERLSSGRITPTENLEKYFTPGSIVKSYGGQDKVLSFNPPGNNNGWNWSVTVVEADESGQPRYGARQRTHSTQPSETELRKRGLGGGSSYRVDLKPEMDEYLDWDKPLSEQSDKVRTALASLELDRVGIPAEDGVRGRHIYDAIWMNEQLGGTIGEKTYSKSAAQQAASNKLLAAGIRGIKYVGEYQNTGGEGTENYVIFDDADIEIEEAFDQGKRRKAKAGTAKSPDGKQRRAQIVISKGKAIIRAFENQQVDSLLHEFVHLFTQDAKPEVADALRRVAGVKGQTWTRKNHERVVKQFMIYMRTGKAPNTRVASAFASFRDWLGGLYISLRGSTVEKRMHPDARALFDSWFETQAQVDASTTQARSTQVDPVEQAPGVVSSLRSEPAVASEQAGDGVVQSAVQSGYVKNAQDDREGKIARAPVPGTKPISAPETIRTFTAARAAMSPDGKPAVVRVGRLAGHEGKAEAIYKTRERVTRLGTANAVFAAAHEVAHDIEEMVWRGLTNTSTVKKNPKSVPADHPWYIRRGRTTSKAGINTTARDELNQISQASYPGKYNKTPRLKLSEGFAEYMRLYLTNKADAVARAPEFTKWFEGYMATTPAKTQKAMAAAAAAGKRYWDQGSLNRGHEAIVDTSALSYKIKGWIKRFMGTQWTRDWAEKNIEYKRIVAEVEKRGVKVAAMDNPYILEKYFQGSAAALAKRWVLDAGQNLFGLSNGQKSLASILAKIPNHKIRDFGLYLFAKRAIAMHTDPKGARQPGPLSLEDANEIRNELETQDFLDTGKEVWDYLESLLKVYESASPSAAKSAAAIRARDPGFYIPLQRVFDDIERAIQSSGTGSGGGQGTLKKLRGSGLRISAVLDQIVTHTQSMLELAQKEMVQNAVLKLAEVDGMGEIIEKLTPDMVRTHKASIDEALTAINAALRKHGVTVTTNGKIMEDVNGVEQEMNPLDFEILSASIGKDLPFFGRAATPTGTDPVFALVRGGTVEWYYMKPELLQLMQNERGAMAHGLAEANSWLVGEGLQAMNRTFKAGVTTLAPGFSMFTNPARDTRAYFFNSQEYNPAKQLWSYMVSLVQGSVYAASAGKIQPGWTKVYHALSMEMANSLGQDRISTRRTASEVKHGKKVLSFASANKALDYVIGLMQLTESVPRMAEMINVAKKNNFNYKADTLTPELAVLLRLAAKEVTVDFTAGGSFAQEINKTYAFFNVAIQGPRAAYRSFRRNPGVFMARGATVAALQAMLWLKYHDEEWWKQLSPEEKLRNTHLIVTINGREERLRIPHEPTADMFFSGLMTAALEAAYGDDPEQAVAMAEIYVRGSIPNFLPQPLWEIVQQTSDWDFFTNRTIVPRGMGEGSVGGGNWASEQYTEYNSEGSKKLGKVLGLSPARIDHWLAGTFGPLAGFAMRAAGQGPAKTSAGDSISDIPVFGRMFARGGKMGTQQKDLDKFFDFTESLQKDRNSMGYQETEMHAAARKSGLATKQIVIGMLKLRADTPTEEERRKITDAVLTMVKEYQNYFKDVETGPP